MGNNRNRRNKEYSKDKDRKPYDKSRRDGREGKDREGRKSKPDETDTRLASKGRDNDPNWYFSDAKLAEQVTRLSFNNLQGRTVSFGALGTWRPRNVSVRYLNPSAGVTYGGYTSNNPSPGSRITSHPYNPKDKGVNLAGFKVYQALNAYTGRVTGSYAPQDITMMILGLGEVVSCMEYLRRAFGVAFLWSQRDRSYPEKILSAMGIDATDFYTNYANYERTFNKMVTSLNKIPIPKGIGYLEKCASLYEKIYTDSDSAMANIVFDVPKTTWTLDETSYAGGTILATSTWTHSKTGSYSVKTVGTFLSLIEGMINALLNSSTLNIVYTDLLNLSSKMNIDFWVMDYLYTGYRTPVEFNPNYLLQLHNTSMIINPSAKELHKFNFSQGGYVTPYNDVYPDTNNNAVVYNPLFPIAVNSASDEEYPCLPMSLLDNTTAEPTTVDVIEATRFIIEGGGVFPCDYTESGATYHGVVNVVLPDHYCAGLSAFLSDGSRTFNSKHFYYTTSEGLDFAERFSQLDWHPIFYRVKHLGSAPFTPHFNDGLIGDTNFFTTVDIEWLRNVNDFIDLHLYSVMK